jgi:phage internal scaffolding protein
MKTIFFRTPYNYDTDKVSDETGLACLDPSLTQQSFREDSDINVILERFNITGELPSNVREPQYGDFLDSPVDYKSALDVVMSAQSAFNDLSAKVRTRFDNDPSKFVDFLSDEKNRDEAIELGLLNATQVVVSPSGDGAPAAQAAGDAQLPT